MRVPQISLYINYNSNVHIPDSFKLVEEFHGQFKIGGGKKRSAPRLEGKRKKRRGGDLSWEKGATYLGRRVRVDLGAT